MAERALSVVDVDADAATGLLEAMIRLQREGERAVQGFVAERLAMAGAAVERLTYLPCDVALIDEFAAEGAGAVEPRESIVGTFRATGDHGRSLLLFAHPDTEVPLPDSGWSRDPFVPAAIGGRIHGWGVADDLAGLAIALLAMDAIRHAGIGLAGDVIVASTPSKRHARGIAAVLYRGYVADAAIYLHPAESGAGMREIKAFASGELEFTVTVRGRRPQTAEPAHTAFAHTAVNPIDKALVLVDALRALDTDRGKRVDHPRLRGAIGRSTNLMISQIEAGRGEPRSRMPLEATFGGTCSFPPGETLAAVRAEVTAALEIASRGDAWLSANPPELRWLAGVTGAEVSDEHPLYRTVAGAVSEICGFVPRVNPMHTSSDIRNPMVQKGIPTVGLGPLCGDLTMAGGVDEWVDRDDYLRAVKVAVASIVAWCGVAPTGAGR